EQWRSGDVLRSMWSAVASGRVALRTLRQNRAWTDRASAQPGSRPCPAGRHSLDGVLGVARGCRSGGDRDRADDLRARDPYSQRPASRDHGLAAASDQLRRMVDPGESRGRVRRRGGLLQRQGWARIFALVVGFVALLNVPIGTALGIYTLWVLLPRQSDDEYKALAQAA